MMPSQRNGPPDGGWGWMCVLGKLISYFFILGSSSAFGIIYIDLNNYYNTTREESAWTGSLSLGVTYLMGPIASILSSRFGIQKTTAAGTLIAFSGCFISWFANGISYLYVSYGVIMGIGLSLVFMPTMLIVAQYFDARLGLANAIGSIGSSLGTVVLPPLYTYLLEEYGWRGTLLLISGIILNGFVCAVIFIPPPYLKGLSKSSTSNTAKSSSRNLISFVCSPRLMLFITGVPLAYTGYLVPFVHLPDMAVLIGIEKYQAANLITIIGVSNVSGRLFFGWISDFPCVNIIFLQGFSLMVCGVVTAVCPHLTEFYALACYSVIFGTFIGVFMSQVPVIAMNLVGLSRMGDLLGMLMLLSGITITASSPLAGWLFDITRTYEVSFYVAGCSFFLAGVMSLIVMFLHNRHTKQETGTEISEQTVSQSQINIEQDISQSNMETEQDFSQSHMNREQDFSQSTMDTEQDFEQSRMNTEQDFEQSRMNTEQDFEQSHMNTEQDFSQTHIDTEQDFSHSHMNTEQDFSQSHVKTEQDFSQSHVNTERNFGIREQTHM